MLFCSKGSSRLNLSTNSTESEVTRMEILKIAAVLIVMVIMFKKKIQVGHVLFTCALLFAVIYRVPPLNLARIFLDTLTSLSTLTIISALYLITLMELLMRHVGSQGRLVAGLQATLGSPRLSMAVLPAIVGFLPSPGGARFSAPMVEEASKNLEISNEEKAVINYYYRHVWELFLPLYPATLLAVETTQIPLYRYMLVMFPMSILVILFGLILYRNFPQENGKHQRIFSNTNTKGIWEGLAPVLATMLLVLVFRLNIVISLLIVDIALFVLYRINPTKIRQLLYKALEPRLLYLVFSALFLRFVLEGSGGMDKLLAYFQVYGLSTKQIAIFFPFTVGFLAGLSIAHVAIALPVIVSLTDPASILNTTVLAVLSGYIGQMLSPMHLCLLMSVEHFKADFSRTYRKLLLPELLLFAAVLVYVALL